MQQRNVPPRPYFPAPVFCAYDVICPLPDGWTARWIDGEDCAHYAVTHRDSQAWRFKFSECDVLHEHDPPSTRTIDLGDRIVRIASTRFSDGTVEGRMAVAFRTPGRSRTAVVAIERMPERLARGVFGMALGAKVAPYPCEYGKPTGFLCSDCERVYAKAKELRDDLKGLEDLVAGREPPKAP